MTSCQKFEEEETRLIKGDCLEAMDKLIKEGVKVDAIITDPPYGMSYSRHIQNPRFDKIENDGDVFYLYEFVNKIYTLSNDNSYI